MHDESPAGHPWARRLGKVGIAPIVVLALSLVATACAGPGDKKGEEKDKPSASSGPKVAEVKLPARGKPSPTAPELKRFYGQKVDWGECPAKAAAVSGVPGMRIVPGTQCAKVTVPLDYSKPDGETVELFVSRRRAEKPKQRLGSLVYNPGGPGGPGAAIVATGAWNATTDVIKRYDVVGFDPRGVGMSQPVNCGPYEEEDYPPLKDRKGFNAIVKEFESEIGLCVKHTGKLLGQVGTVNVARDLDIIREVLGDERLNYVGQSYGTLLGVRYLEQFGDRAGRIVLDSVDLPSVGTAELLQDQTSSFEMVYRKFLKSCVDGGGCPAGKDVDTAYENTRKLVAKLEAKSLPTANKKRKLTDDRALTGLIAGMYAEEAWPMLKAGLQEAMKDGKGTTLLLLSDLYSGTDSKTGKPLNNSTIAAPSVNCLDRKREVTTEQVWSKYRPALAKRSPLFGEQLAMSLLSCALWPEKPTPGPTSIDVKNVPPVLIASNTKDPATPHKYAVQLSKDLPGAVLVSREKAGHGAYGTRSDCVDERVARYLNANAIPAKDMTCKS